jgi:hypothetical protein
MSNRSLQPNTRSLEFLLLLFLRIPNTSMSSLQTTLRHLLLLLFHFIEILLRLRIATPLAVKLVTKLFERFLLIH